MSESENAAKFRVELANKGALKDFFGQTLTEVRKFSQETKRELTAAGKEVEGLARTTETATGKTRVALSGVAAGAGTAAQGTRQLATAADQGSRSLAGLGNHAGAARRSSQALAGALGGELKTAIGSVGSSAASAAKGLLALVGVGAGVGVVSGAKAIIDLDDAVAGLAATAGLGDDKIAGLRQQIIDTSLSTKVFGKDLTEALNAFVAKTGDIETGRANLKLYGDTARATRASVMDIANIGADLNKLNITDQAKAFQVLAKQSDVGQVELKDLVSQGPRLLSAFQGAGLSGERGLREGGALAQIATGATGNVERASTSIEAVFRDLIEKAPRLRQGGINVFDPKTHVANDPVEVLLETIRKTNGHQDTLSGIFGGEAMRVITPLAADYRETKRFGKYETFRDVQADSSIMDRKRQLNTSTAAARIEAAQIQIQADAMRNFTGVLNGAVNQVDKFATAIDWMSQHMLTTAALAVGGAAGIGLAKRGAGAAASWAGRRLFGAAGGGAAGAVAGTLGGEGTPVYVTNWPAGGIGGSDGITSALGKAGTAAGGAAGGTVAAIAASAAAVVTSGIAGYELGTWLDERFHLSDKIAGVHGNGVQQDGSDFWSNGERRFAAQKNERDMFNRLKGKVASGEITPTEASQQLARFSASAEGAGDVAHISDGTKVNEYGTSYGLNARAFTEQLAAAQVDPAARRARLQREGGPAALGSLSDNAGLMFEQIAGKGARDRAASFLGGVVDAAQPAFAGAPAALLPENNFAFVIEIAGEEVSIHAPTGTRAPEVQVRRKAGGG